MKPYKVRLEGGREHEIDIWARSYIEGQDLFIEVKNWDRKVTAADVDNFIKAVKDMEAMGTRGYYIYYAVNGFDEAACEVLQQTGIMYADSQRWPIV